MVKTRFKRTQKSTTQFNMKNAAIIFLCGFLSAIGLGAEPEIKGTPSELANYLSNVSRFVTIHGDAELRVPADKASVLIKVTSEGRFLQQALRDNEEARNRLYNQLKLHNIPQERIMAAKFSSTPKYGLFSEKAKSYRVENLVKVIVMDDKEFQAIAGAVDTAPELQFAGIDFEHNDKDTAKSKVIAMACEKANQRRELYEQKLGIKLTAARFVEGPISQKAPLSMQRNYGDRAYPKSAGSATAAALPRAESDEESITPFGEIIYTVEVAVEFTVQSK